MAMRRWNDRFPPEMDDGRHYTFYYQIERCLNYNRRIIEEAMDEIELYSTIRFEPRRRHPCYLTITKSDGCWTVGTGEDCRPRISLGMGSPDFGDILHELLHAIGFEHEHNRPDRNRYLIINWRNILNGEKLQFQKLRRYEYDWNDFYIDYESVMIYDSYGSSKNDKKTILRKDGGVIEIIDELSDMDIVKLSLL